MDFPPGLLPMCFFYLRGETDCTLGLFVGARLNMFGIFTCFWIFRFFELKIIPCHLMQSFTLGFYTCGFRGRSVPDAPGKLRCPTCGDEAVPAHLVGG